MTDHCNDDRKCFPPEGLDLGECRCSCTGCLSAFRLVVSDFFETDDLHCDHEDGLCRTTVGAACDGFLPTAIYACNLGAGGIDYRCGMHVIECLMDPDNIEAGITWADYESADADDSDAVCEVCAPAC